MHSSSTLAQGPTQASEHSRMPRGYTGAVLVAASGLTRSGASLTVLQAPGVSCDGPTSATSKLIRPLAPGVSCDGPMSAP